MKTVYLSLGSNIGDRAKNIAQAVEMLGSRGVRVLRQSSLYETEPVEVREQDWFLNCVIEVESELPAEKLMQELLAIERSLGRGRRVPKGPRTIDMDILLYGSEYIDTPGLRIPHPEWPSAVSC